MNGRMAGQGDQFLTVSRLGKSELLVKGSRFIGQAFPVDSPEEAEEKIQAVREHFRDATHNCYAYRVGRGPQAVYRFHDDGEPAGTAGRPILQAMESKGLTNVAVVVTRYFGGTKLGAGGLVRAYSSAAAAALDDAIPVAKSVETELRIQVPYAYLQAVQQVVERTGGRVVRSTFAERVTLTVAVAESKRGQLVASVTNATAGRVAVEE